MLNIIKKVIKNIFPGVSWQNPVVNRVFQLIDPIDYLVRKVRKLPDMPIYSIRVRSNGITGQFGGRQFIRNGNLIAELLKDLAKITPKDKILEVGCGCGRNAIALTTYLDNSRYTGIDIEKKSLDSCRANQLLVAKAFKFEELNVYNAEYNPSGKYKGSEYQFPFEKETFNNVFLISVFTHMMPDDVANYIKQISDILVDGGTCFISTFLMDRGTRGERISFPHQEELYCTNNIEMPEIAIGYKLDFYKKIADTCNMSLLGKPIWGTWIETIGLEKGRFPQDIIILEKNAIK